MKVNTHADFEPSEATLKSWLQTRKRPIQAGSSTLSGLFITDGYERDRGLFIAAAIIEFAAIVFIIVGGLLGGSSGLILAVITAAFIVLFDIIGVFFHHLKIGERQKLKVEAEVHLHKRADIESKLSKTHWSNILGWILLFLSAILKIGSVYLFVVFANDIILGSLIVLYVFVLYVHARHTGYWHAESKRLRLLKKDYVAWAEDLAKLQNPGNMSLKEKIDEVRNHSINRESFQDSPNLFNFPDVKNSGSALVVQGNDDSGEESLPKTLLKLENHNEKTGKYTYRISSYGLVHDAVLTDFISTQYDANKFAIAVAIRLHQLEKF